MKKWITVVFLLSPMLAFGQDMNAMMAKMQAMQACMENIDQSELEALGQRGQQLQSQIKSLCDRGQLDEAKRQAMDFGREVNESKILQQVKACAEPLAGMIPMPDYSELEKDYANIDICAE